MIFSCNRLAIIPRLCFECKRYIWMEPYRRADVWHGGFINKYWKENICSRCLVKFVSDDIQ